MSKNNEYYSNRLQSFLSFMNNTKNYLSSNIQYITLPLSIGVAIFIPNFLFDMEYQIEKIAHEENNLIDEESNLKSQEQEVSF